MNEYQKKRDLDGIYFLVECDAGKVTTVSAYDLLPEEDRDALAWVREMGGVEAVEKRLMPEGMEWPKYTDGELVRIGGCWGEDGCDTSITYIERIIFAEDGVYLDNEYNEAFYRHGERVKRPAPKVLDADGVPIKEGDEVWSTRDSKSGTVVYAYPPGDDGQPSVKVGATWHHASDLTHEQPDDWSRWREDLELSPVEYADRYRVGRFGHEELDTYRDLVRRCKALAERGE